MKSQFFSIFFIVTSTVFSQNTSQKAILQNDTLSSKKITQVIYFGGAVTVPPNKIWKIQRVFVNNGTYNISCCIEMKGKTYKEGEKIFAPSFSADAALLSDDITQMQFIFEIDEKEGN